MKTTKKKKTTSHQKISSENRQASSSSSNSFRNSHFENVSNSVGSNRIKIVKSDLEKKRDELVKLQEKLSPKLNENLRKTLINYLFKSQEINSLGGDHKNYFETNVKNIKNKLKSDPQDIKLFEEIIAKQQEIIDLENNQSSTQAQNRNQEFRVQANIEISPPPYNRIS